MIVPLDKLVGYRGNVYEMTSATVRRALQITVTGDEDLDKNDGKVVSTAINQILTNKVEYRLEE
jgi:DNA-directed RNA polymerase subunit omega